MARPGALCGSLLLTALLIFAPASFATSPDGPADCVERLHGTLLDIMKRADELGYAGREKTVEPAVTQAYDTSFMARKSVGSHWKKLSPEEQEQFVTRFGNLTAANYAGRFNGWSGESFETLGEKPGVHETILVRTKLVRPDDEDVSLDYRLHQTESGWRIIDVYANGTISELALRRSEYSALLRREGFDSLIEALDKKIGELKEEG